VPGCAHQGGANLAPEVHGQDVQQSAAVGATGLDVERGFDGGRIEVAIDRVRNSRSRAEGLRRPAEQPNQTIYRRGTVQEEVDTEDRPEVSDVERRLSVGQGNRRHGPGERGEPVLHSGWLDLCFCGLRHHSQLDLRWCLVSQRNNLGIVQCRLVRVSATCFPPLLH